MEKSINYHDILIDTSNIMLTNRIKGTVFNWKNRILVILWFSRFVQNLMSLIKLSSLYPFIQPTTNGILSKSVPLVSE